KTGQGEESRGEEIRPRRNPLGVQATVLGELAGQEDGAQGDRGDEPEEEATGAPARQPAVREPGGAAAGEQREAEERRPHYLQVGRPGPGAAPTIGEVGRDQGAEEDRLGRDEGERSHDGDRRAGEEAG